MKKPFTPYQHRATKLVWAWRIYAVVGIVAIPFLELRLLGGLVLITGWVILYGIAAMSDAVFDSLNERINIQSAWLAHRIDAIEFPSKGQFGTNGQMRWVTKGVPTDRSSYYFDNFPEQFSAEDQKEAWKLIEKDKQANAGANDQRA